MMTAGHHLRAVREQLGFTIRDVEAASQRLAEKYGNEDFNIPPSRLSDMETKGVLPNIYRLYALAVIYRRDVRELLAFYGIDTSQMASDLGVSEPPRSHCVETLAFAPALSVPVHFDPAFDPRRTANLGRMIEKWGLVPMAFLSQFASSSFTYAYIGMEDFSMYPILPPGSFVQVDETRNKVTEEFWASEYERPIYFIETRTGYFCSWCSLRDHTLILQPHPLSPATVRIFRHPQEAEVVGEVVAIAKRVSDWRVSGGSEPASKARLKLS